MKIGKPTHFKTRQVFRQWLKKNYNKKDCLWLLIYKQHAKEKGLTYPEALEEALCYGWIDGILKRIDNEKHVIRFSPRRPDSVWSKHNINHVMELIRQKKMRKAGLDTLPKKFFDKLAKNKKHFKITKNRKLLNKFGVKIY